MEKMVNPGMSRAQWAARLARRSTLVIALCVSMAVHFIIYWITPRFATTFTPAKPVEYDATLVPLESVPTSQTPLETGARNGKRPNARPSASSVAASRRTTPKSTADFVAPENAMSVAAATEPTTDPNAAPPTAADSGAGVGNPATGVEKPTGTPAGDATTGNEAASRVSTDPATPPVVAQAPARRAPAFAECISIEYKLTTAITDGVASFRWTRRGAEYEIESSIQATGFLVSAFAGVIHQQSRGTITDDGLRPQQFSIRRGEGEAELAEFRRSTNALAMKRNGETRSVPLTRDMQDMQSFLFQLAYDAPYLAESGDKLDVLVTNARKVYRYQFRKLATETLDTRMGQIETIRLLSEAANPEDQYEVWLAPGYFYLPMKLKYYLGRFQVEQLVTRIGVSGEVTAR
jgi:hypothetical protein